MVLSSNTIVVVVLMVLALGCTAVRIMNHNRDCGKPGCDFPTVSIAIDGGLSAGNVNAPEFKRIDAEVRKKHPEVKSPKFKVTSVKNQPVTGTKWQIIYSPETRKYSTEALDPEDSIKWYITYSRRDQKYEAKVLDQPELNKITVQSFKKAR